MKKRTGLVAALVLLCLTTGSFAQSSDAEDTDDLKMTALEALVGARPERALPIVEKVLAGNNGMELKKRALFVLSQFDTADAQSRLITIAREDQGELRIEAIRMLGISGGDAAISALGEIYQSGDADVSDAILEAYMIADEPDAIFQIAVNANNEDDFSNAVELLGAMGAREQLRELRNRVGMSESLVEAYAISGDAGTLRELALDGSDAEVQIQAIEALGIVGGDETGELLVSVYRNAGSDDIREAALDGMLIAGYDEGVLMLYRDSNSTAEKKNLLEMLMMMGSDEVWNLIDSALQEPN